MGELTGKLRQKINQIEFIMLALRRANRCKNNLRLKIEIILTVRRVENHRTKQEIVVIRDWRSSSVLNIAESKFESTTHRVGTEKTAGLLLNFQKLLFSSD